MPLPLRPPNWFVALGKDEGPSRHGTDGVGAATADGALADNAEGVKKYLP